MWVDQKEYEKLGEVLKIAREAAGWGQQALAAELGKPQSFISNYEIGQRRLDLLEFLVISTTLKLNPNELFSEISRKMKKPLTNNGKHR